jgi:long-chain acyl-CoA synthetase
MKSILPAPRILFETAAKYPDRIRFVEDGRAITLGELAGRVASFATHLRRERIGRGDHVAIWSPNRLEWIIAALAAQAVGGAFVGVHAGSSSEIATFVVTHSQAKLLIACREELARAGNPPVKVPVLLFGDDFARVSRPGQDPATDASRFEDRACVIYTSGSTGMPKGVALTHANLAANGSDWMEVCGPLVPRKAREVLWLPFSHVFGWGDACIGMLAGLTSYLTAPSDVVGALATVKPHVFMTVPLLLEKLARAAPSGAELKALMGGEIELCLVGAAPFSPRLKQRYREAGVPVFEGYGLTETSPTLTLERRGDPTFDHAGSAYPSVELRIAPDGEVLARGPSVFSGYWNDPEATRQALDAEGWFHTGDLGELDAQGRLKIRGRKKALLVLSSGKKVSSEPIELRAAEDPLIERLVLFGNGKPVVVGLIEPNREAVCAALKRTVAYEDMADDADVRALLADRVEALNARLSTFERIRNFAISRRPLSVERGDLSPSMKLRRHVVWEAFADTFESLYAQTRPA